MTKKRVVRFPIIPCLFLAVLVLTILCTARAQNDYPPAQGGPDAWETGHGRLELPAPAKPSGPPDIFTEPRPQGNADLNEPNVPAGEAEEKYTGPAEFGGIAGTGITPSGPEDKH